MDQVGFQPVLILKRPLLPESLAGYAGNRSIICSPKWSGLPMSFRPVGSTTKSSISRGIWPTKTGHSLGIRHLENAVRFRYPYLLASRKSRYNVGFKKAGWSRDGGWRCGYPSAGECDCAGRGGGRRRRWRATSLPGRKIAWSRWPSDRCWSNRPTATIRWCSMARAARASRTWPRAWPRRGRPGIAGGPKGTVPFLLTQKSGQSPC